MIKRIIRLAIVFVMICHGFFVPAVHALEQETDPGSSEAVEAIPAPPAAEAKDTPPSVVESAPAARPTVLPPTPAPSALPAIQKAEVEESPLILPSVIINRVVAGISGQSAYEFIELYNPNPHDVIIDAWQVQVIRKNGDVKEQLSLSGTVKAHSYILVAGKDPTLNDFTPDLFLKAESIVTTDGTVRLLDKTQSVIDKVQWDATSSGLRLPTGNMIERNYSDGVPWITGDNSKDFTSKPNSGSPRAGGYIPYLPPVNRCSGIVISEIAANASDDKQFIELYNSTSLQIRLDDCLLQTNRSATKSFVLKGTMSANQYKSFLVATTGLTLTKTTSGTVYLLSSDGKEETDVRTYEDLAAGTSWAWFGGDDWRQTFAMSPGSHNVWQEFLPCEAGYERNLETGRCRKVVVESAGLISCEAGKYRNPETGRCRSVEAADVLTPCKVGQFRSPETNRCRSLAAAASALTPCRPNQERNPETNRCRNVVTDVPASAFAVEPIKDSEQTFAGWWIFGGVGLLLIGYGVWEWRKELLALAYKARTIFSKR